MAVLDSVLEVGALGTPLSEVLGEKELLDDGSDVEDFEVVLEVVDGEEGLLLKVDAFDHVSLETDSVLDAVEELAGLVGAEGLALVVVLGGFSSLPWSITFSPDGSRLLGCLGRCSLLEGPLETTSFSLDFSPLLA